jgi:hypothetical protein
MDEVGTNTTKRMAKVFLASSNYRSRLFSITPEGGDGRMNMHVTACITTRGDGTCGWLLGLRGWAALRQGCRPPFVVVLWYMLMYAVVLYRCLQRFEK